MKTLFSKSGLLITMLLVAILIVVGYAGQRGKIAKVQTAVEKQASNSVQSKLNLKGMTRHLLDFYK
jgi:hypothetical protein